MGLFSKFITSITKPSDYKKFMKDSLGKALLYLFIIAIIFSSFLTIKRVKDYNYLIEKLVEKFKMKSPDFKLEDGELRVDAQMPYIVQDTKENKIFVIDTSGQSTEDILNNYKEGVLVTKTGAIHKKSQYEIRKYNFSSFKELTLTKRDLVNLLPLLKWISIFIVIFGLLFFWFEKLISALILSLLGLIIKKIVKIELNFGTIYKLSIYALTTSILFKVFFQLANITVPFFFLIYYGVGVFYLWQAISNINESCIDLNFD